MPSSPAVRCSPGKALRVHNHKRGRSLEGGLLFRGKDDDLAMFNEMQNKKKDDFLLQSFDDFEDTFSTKLKHFSDYKLEISIPVPAESSDLFNADGVKNDYDWLLTPPDTPLFPSLDDEPVPASVICRGRPRSQPVSISRSSTMEKSQRSNRGSASPNRLSASPRSGNSTFQSRGRPSLASNSSPISSQRNTQLRRPSPPPGKPSMPGPLSTTPTRGRMNTRSSVSMTSSNVKEISPVKTKRGSSASPKTKAWQTNIHGFSTDAPPNLLTSLADRPVSYVRGSSSKFSRQSMSPTASRSVGSSHSHDRDRFSSHSKGSLASSGDDVDSLQRIPLDSDLSASKKVGPYPKSFTKKSARVLSPSSAPKKSFDSALRQMDHRRSPPKMFRTLLSSVPSTTFYAGKSNSPDRPMTSRNSIVSTSSIASSDQGASVPHDTQDYDHKHDNITSECGKVLYPDVQEEVFVFDNADTVTERVQHEIHDESLEIQFQDFNRGCTVECDSLYAKGEFLEVDIFDDMELCIKCNRMYHSISPEEGAIKMCPDCCRKQKKLTITSPETTIASIENSPELLTKTLGESRVFEKSMLLPESPEVTYVGEPQVLQHQENVKKCQNPLDEQIQSFSGSDSVATLRMKGEEQRRDTHQEGGQPTNSCSLSANDSGIQQLEHVNNYHKIKVDIADSSGISVLLNRSSSSKESSVQGRTSTANTIPREDLFYARDGANSMRSSFGHGSASTSSSVDYSSSRQTETRVQRQLSGRKSDLESHKNEITMKSQSIETSVSEVSSQNHQAIGLPARTCEENSEVSVCTADHDAVDDVSVTSHKQAEAGSINKLLHKSAIPEADICELDDISRTVDESATEYSSPTVSIQLEEKKVAPFLNCEETESKGIAEGYLRNTKNVSSLEAPTLCPVEHTELNKEVDLDDLNEVSTLKTLVSLSEIESENLTQNIVHPQIDGVPLKSRTMEELQHPSDHIHIVNDSVTSFAEVKTLDNTHGILEESTVMLEARGGSKARSLTLEEATDTILFCSSIVHDLAYQAATVAMENESSVTLQVSRPMVTILGKSNTNRMDTRRKTVGKRSSKSQKARQMRSEIDAKSPYLEIENDENMEESLPRNVGLPNKVDSINPPKLESKCNCTIV